MKKFKNYIKGMAIGIATLIPGVSGGTMAIILGVYDNLIHAVSSFFEDWKKNSITLFEIGFGAVLGIVLFSKIFERVLIKYSSILQFLFLGIIIGGLPVLFKKAKSTKEKNNKKSNYLFIVLGFIVVLLLCNDPTLTTALATNTGTSSLIFLFLGGIVLSIALVLPGISASFMLLALGLYEITLSAINNLNLLFLLPLVIGVIVGTLATTKIIENLIKRYPEKTYMLIIGFVIGSLIPIFPGIPSGINILISAIIFIIGFFITYILGRLGIED